MVSEMAFHVCTYMIMERPGGLEVIAQKVIEKNVGAKKDTKMEENLEGVEAKILQMEAIHNELKEMVIDAKEKKIQQGEEIYCQSWKGRSI